MPPLFVDGVEIKSVFVDGVEQDSVFADGVEVFSVVAGEDYIDDFLRDPNGTLITDHLMNTGQGWDTSAGTPTQPVIGDAVQAGSGNQSAIVAAVGENTAFNMIPLVSLFNQSFVSEANFSWEPFAGTLFVLIVQISIADSPDTYVQISGGLGSYSWAMTVNDVAIAEGSFSNQDQSAVKMTMFYDGTDMAAEFILQPSGERIVVPQQAVPAITGIERRVYPTTVLPLGGQATAICMYDVTETAVSSFSMPWPV